MSAMAFVTCKCGFDIFYAARRITTTGKVAEMRDVLVCQNCGRDVPALSRRSAESEKR